MNLKLILFSGVVTAVVGTGIGIVAAELFPTPYASALYQGLERKYAIVGGVAGLMIGCCQEMIREAKAERDAEDNLLQDLEKSLRATQSSDPKAPRNS